VRALRAARLENAESSVSKLRMGKVAVCIRERAIQTLTGGSARE
jgi:hypothetical protein